MDGLREAPLGKALDLLLKSVASGIGVELGYEIDRGVITVATADSLPSAERRLSQITHTDTPVEMLLSRKEYLFRDKQELEMKIARYEAHLPALEGQIARINEQVTEKLAADPVTVELQKIADLHLGRVEHLKKLVEGGDGGAGHDLERTIEKLAKAKIELAKRREELSNAAGGDRLKDLNVNLTDLMIDLAVNRAEFEVVSRQLAETEAQLKTASNTPCPGRVGNRRAPPERAANPPCKSP
jgi:chromosome segregation ATPase